MNILNRLLGRYRNDEETVIISCFFNPLGSAYRKKAFDIFYDSIKHLNHRVVECVIGNAVPQLPENENISRVHTKDLLWHKEALLNGVIAKLPRKFKYVLWVDADVIFTNKNWMVDAAEELRKNRKIVQLFDYCVHLNRDETKPSFDFNERERRYANQPKVKRKDVWKGFASVCVNRVMSGRSEVYDEHGHVGFAWGARRSLLEEVPLYDKALIGGADHIIAHAAAGHMTQEFYQAVHPCISKTFTADLVPVTEWSRKFMRAVGCMQMGYVKGDLYHIWHGDVDKRDYFNRIKQFTPQSSGIVEKDNNGLYLNNDKKSDGYLREYFNRREVLPDQPKDYHHGKVVEKKAPQKAPKRSPRSRSSSGVNRGLAGSREEYRGSRSEDDGFLTSMAVGYMTDSTLAGSLIGGNVVGAMLGDSIRGDSNSHGMRPDSTATPLSVPRTYTDEDKSPSNDQRSPEAPSDSDRDAQNCGNFS